MKTFLKLLTLTGVTFLLLASCSRTRDAVGLDTINNQVKTGRWTVFEREIYTPPTATTSVKTDLLGDNQYLKFESNGVAKVYNSDGTATSTTYSYSFVDTKTIVFNGETYKIQENFVGTISKMTLVHEGTVAKTVYTFQR